MIAINCMGEMHNPIIAPPSSGSLNAYRGGVGLEKRGTDHLN
jgi:hypothetical protein